MSMSTHVVGIIPADEKYEKMKAIWVLCNKSAIYPPDEVVEFFRGEIPDGTGVEVQIEGTLAVDLWAEDTCQGFQVDITKLPPDVKIVRFYNAW